MTSAAHFIKKQQKTTVCKCGVTIPVGVDWDGVESAVWRLVTMVPAVVSDTFLSSLD